MSEGASPRILVLSSRPDILSDVSESARQLDPAPPVGALQGAGRLRPDDLVLVDVAEPLASVDSVRRRFGAAGALVALIEGAWVSRLGDALAGEWDDYLFFPLNLDELGLVWRRHVATGASPEPSLEVDSDGVLRMVIPARVTDQRPAVERVVEACRHLAELDPDTAFRVRVALGEAVANAILYGSGKDPHAFVRVEAQARPAELILRVSDEGRGFDPEAVPDPTAPGGLLRSRGRGLFLMRRLCEEIRFNEAGNEVTLVFRSAQDPLHRIGPWLGPFGHLTGLQFRLERTGAEGPEPIHDGLSAEPPGEVPAPLAERTIGPEGSLRLAYRAAEAPAVAPDPERAADVLAGWLGAIVESEVARERLLERRMRRQRVLAELEVARDLQLKLMPSPVSFADVARVAARCEPALSLGGDFYYLARPPGAGVGAMLGDVSSHGPSAALLMALTLSSAAIATEAEPRPARALRAMHEQLLGALESTDMYMTLFYGILDREAGVLHYANAGHPFAYRISAGAATRLPALAPPIGMGDPSEYEDRTIDWSAADTLLLFTDGLAELSDPLDEPASAIHRAVRSGEADPEALVEALFAGASDDMRLDDRTAVAVRV